MAKKDFTKTSKILMSLLLAGDMFLVTPYELSQRLRKGKILGDGKSLLPMLYYLAKQGLIKYVDKNNERFIKLTGDGELEALLAKARLPRLTQKWNRKWCVIIFDIPEQSRSKRGLFRLLLKANGFRRFQDSVYISPYPINRDAIAYLQKSKLINYIRILKVEEIDDDTDLKKVFNLH